MAFLRWTERADLAIKYEKLDFDFISDRMVCVFITTFTYSTRKASLLFL